MNNVMSSREITWRYTRELKALPPYDISIRSRKQRELTTYEIRQLYDRLSIPTRSRYFCIPCEEHGTTRCKECKPTKVPLELYRQIKPQDQTKWRRWLVIDVTSGLPFIPTGEAPDRDIIECMVQYLVQDTAELTFEDPTVRLERMMAVCLSQMIFFNADERLAGLIPEAYQAATVINAQRSDEALDRIDNLEDGHVALANDVATLQDNQRQSDRRLQTLSTDQCQTEHRLRQTESQVSTMYRAMVKANLFGESTTDNKEVSSPTVDRLVARVGTPLAEKKQAANAITPMPLDLEIDSTTAFTVIGNAGYVPENPNGFTKTKLNMPRPLRQFGLGSAAMNKALRSDSPVLDRSVAQDVTLTMTTLSFLPDFKGTVMRACTHTPEFIQRLQQTKVFCDKGFLSTSLGGIHMRYLSMNCRFIITSKTGKYIQPYVSKCYEDENEVTFLPETPFDVVSMAKSAEPWAEVDCFIIHMVEK